uniref:uncharacterized protein n=2 Tax=Myxine glutinosa TaxID=7769 RepID=UPI00358E2446
MNQARGLRFKDGDQSKKQGVLSSLLQKFTGGEGASRIGRRSYQQQQQKQQQKQPQKQHWMLGSNPSDSSYQQNDDSVRITSPRGRPEVRASVCGQGWLGPNHGWPLATDNESCSPVEAPRPRSFSHGRQIHGRLQPSSPAVHIPAPQTQLLLSVSPPYRPLSPPRPSVTVLNARTSHPMAVSPLGYGEASPLEAYPSPMGYALPEQTSAAPQPPKNHEDDSCRKKQMNRVNLSGVEVQCGGWQGTVMEEDYEEDEEVEVEEWERRLDEAQSRASQLEKTMRWWSDCATSWREKWGKVRDERNEAREESRMLQAQIMGLQRQLAECTHERDAAVSEALALRVTLSASHGAGGAAWLGHRFEKEDQDGEAKGSWWSEGELAGHVAADLESSCCSTDITSWEAEENWSLVLSKVSGKSQSEDLGDEESEDEKRLGLQADEFEWQELPPALTEESTLAKIPSLEPVGSEDSRESYDEPSDASDTESQSSNELHVTSEEEK